MYNFDSNSLQICTLYCVLISTHQRILHEMKKSGNFKYNFSYFDTIETSKGNFLGNIGTKIDRVSL